MEGKKKGVALQFCNRKGIHEISNLLIKITPEPISKKIKELRFFNRKGKQEIHKSLDKNYTRTELQESKL